VSSLNEGRPGLVVQLRMGAGTTMWWTLCATHSSVIARLDRAIQYSEKVVIESRGHGVLDAPVKPGHDSVANRKGLPL